MVPSTPHVSMTPWLQQELKHSLADPNWIVMKSSLHLFYHLLYFSLTEAAAVQIKAIYHAGLH